HPPPPPSSPTPPPPSPPPRSAVYWATSAAGSKGDAVPASNKPQQLGGPGNLAGPPKSKVLKAQECAPAGAVSWIPPITGSRFATAYFNQTPAATGGQVYAVVVYVMNKGILDPPITSIALQLRTYNAKREAVTSWVTIYDVSSGQKEELACPGANHFAVPAPTALQLPVGMTSSGFNTADVIAVRININMGAVHAGKADLPHLASVGLVVV
ncbi:hypothetical protein Agub_g2507, partial [Astrephomene gubernaculifera]